MTIILIWLAGIALCAMTGFALSFFISSISEKEPRAVVASGIMTAVFAVFTGVFFLVVAKGLFADGPWFWALAVFDAAVYLAVAAVSIRTTANRAALTGAGGLVTGEVRRFDERDTMFSQLKESWTRPLYAERLGRELAPDERVPDGFINTIKDGEISGSSLPVKGLIDRGGGAAVVAMADACGYVTSVLEQEALLNPPVADQRIEMSPDEAAQRIKGFCHQLGAVLCGITEVDQRWLYANRGVSGVAQQSWGETVPGLHRYAVVIAVEMDLGLINAGPHTPTVLETMHNYARVAFIGAELAAFIARLGYPAKANQMEHYDGLLVPLAVDAGLGELSRMGYLVTKEYGPRVRLNVVFTDLPLQVDAPVDLGVVDFCNVCKKCAHCCPSRSIPLTDRTVHNGSLRWKLDEGSCLKYWQSVGTDCAVCMRVCPFSHARTFPHRLVTELVTRNALARRVFTWMDDVFYGRKPPHKVPPEWADCGMREKRE